MGHAPFSRAVAGNLLDPTASFAEPTPLGTTLLMKSRFAVVIRPRNAVLGRALPIHILDIHDPFIAAAAKPVLVAWVVKTADPSVDSCGFHVLFDAVKTARPRFDPVGVVQDQDAGSADVCVVGVF